jgi:hypothetical protein
LEILQVAGRATLPSAFNPCETTATRGTAKTTDSFEKQKRRASHFKEMLCEIRIDAENLGTAVIPTKHCGCE